MGLDICGEVRYLRGVFWRFLKKLERGLFRTGFY